MRSGTKAIWEVGPFYTASLIPELAAELYPTLSDVPGFDALYRMTGRRPPKVEPDRFVLPASR